MCFISAYVANGKLGRLRLLQICVIEDDLYSYGHGNRESSDLGETLMSLEARFKRLCKECF